LTESHPEATATWVQTRHLLLEITFCYEIPNLMK